MQEPGLFYTAPTRLYFHSCSLKSDLKMKGKFLKIIHEIEIDPDIPSDVTLLHFNTQQHEE